MTMTIQTRKDFTVREVMEFFDVKSEQTIYSWLDKGILDSYKVGRLRRITGESVERVRAQARKGAA